MGRIRTQIIRGKIIKWKIRKTDSFSPLKQIEFKIETPIGKNYLYFILDNKQTIEHKLLEIFQISNLKDLKNKPCLCYYENNYFKSIGSFLYDCDNIDSIDHPKGDKSWIYWDIYGDNILKTIKIMKKKE